MGLKTAHLVLLLVHQEYVKFGLLTVSLGAVSQVRYRSAPDGGTVSLYLCLCGVGGSQFYTLCLCVGGWRDIPLLKSRRVDRGCSCGPVYVLLPPPGEQQGDRNIN